MIIPYKAVYIGLMTLSVIITGPLSANYSCGNYDNSSWVPNRGGVIQYHGDGYADSCATSDPSTSALTNNYSKNRG